MIATQMQEITRLVVKFQQAMILKIENFLIPWMLGGPSNGKLDRLSMSHLKEKRYINTTIKSWHATCRKSAVSKILDWLVQ